MSSHAAPVLHPLSGSSLSTLATVLAKNGFISPRFYLRGGAAAAVAVMRLPFTAAEKVLTRRLIRSMPELKPPVFIIGHWRSGTTHLYNMLAQSGQFGYVPPLATGLPWDQLILARFARPLLERMLPRERFIDRVAVTSESPQEDEAALANMQAISFYHGIYFPERLPENIREGVFFDGAGKRDIEKWQQNFLYLLKKLSLLGGGRRLLIKNPVYTARVDMLRELLPGSRFIHIHRNPYTVFLSMRRFYTRMIDALSLQQAPLEDIDDLILETYSRMMRLLLEMEFRDGEFVEVAFSDLQREPARVIREIYQRLDLGGFDAAAPAIAEYLRTVKDYKKSRYVLSPDLKRKIERHWGEFIDRWGYSAPS